MPGEQQHESTQELIPKFLAQILVPTVQNTKNFGNNYSMQVSLSFFSWFLVKTRKMPKIPRIFCSRKGKSLRKVQRANTTKTKKKLKEMKDRVVHSER